MQNNLLNLRKQHGKTQKEMAEITNTTYQAYQRYENGSREPDFATLLKLADYFNTSIDYLLGRTAEKEGPLQWTAEEIAQGVVPSYRESLSSDELEVLDAYRAIKDEKGEKAAHAMKTLMEAYLNTKK